MNRYMKTETGSKLGKGWSYIELDGEYVTRQVEVYGDRLFSTDDPFEYDPETGFALCDQPLPEAILDPNDDISREEFEEIWQLAQANRQAHIYVKSRND